MKAVPFASPYCGKVGCMLPAEAEPVAGDDRHRIMPADTAFRLGSDLVKAAKAAGYTKPPKDAPPYVNPGEM